MATKEEIEFVEDMSSYSELNDSEAQESISEYSEDDISETSEDRAFVVSDGEQSAYSNRSSASSDYSQYCSNDSSNFVSCLGRSFWVNELTSPEWPESPDKHSYQTYYPTE
jgi:hypothetical protein